MQTVLRKRNLNRIVWFATHESLKLNSLMYIKVAMTVTLIIELSICSILQDYLDHINYLTVVQKHRMLPNITQNKESNFWP